MNNNKKMSDNKFRFVLWVEGGVEGVKNEKLEEIRRKNNLKS